MRATLLVGWIALLLLAAGCASPPSPETAVPSPEAAGSGGAGTGVAPNQSPAQATPGGGPVVPRPALPGVPGEGGAPSPGSPEGPAPVGAGGPDEALVLAVRKLVEGDTVGFHNDLSRRMQARLQRERLKAWLEGGSEEARQAVEILRTAEELIARGRRFEQEGEEAVLEVPAGHRVRMVRESLPTDAQGLGEQWKIDGWE